MTTRRSLCFAMAFGAMPAAFASGPADPLLRQVAERLAGDRVVRGEFEQRKTITGFRKPLVSSGRFVSARDRGVIWLTRQPFTASLVVTPERILARQADGSISRELGAGSEPAVRAISETLFGVMATDFSVLSRRFRIEVELVGAENWRMQLVPRDADLARWLKQIELEGGRFLQGVRLEESRGDRTDIRLFHHSTAVQLSASEEARFE